MARFVHFCPPCVQALFSVALETHVGNGHATLFWKDRWLLGATVVELAPEVMAAVPNKWRNKRSVAEALQDNRWFSDIKGGLSMIGLFEFFQLWDVLLECPLSHEEDRAQLAPRWLMKVHLQISISSLFQWGDYF